MGPYPLIVALCSLMLVALPGMAWGVEPDGNETVYELRTYTTHEGRLPALEARFRDHTTRLFAKHGMRNVGYWRPLDRPDTLIYIIAHNSREAVRSNWQAFAGDQEWQTVARDSQKDGPILVEGGIQSVLMNATDYSPIR